MSNHYCVFCMAQLPPGAAVCGSCGREQAYTAPYHHMLPGTVLRDRYLVGRAIGEGGFGITYIGWDRMLNIRIAIKEFYPNGYSHRMNTVSNHVTMTNSGSDMDYQKDMQRFLNEARNLARFSDEPGIVGVRDFFRENGTAYIVMEYLDGITLKAYLNSQGTLNPGSVFDMLRPVMASLARIHSEGLIHRDISPDNIMILRSGKVKLLDFGAAREVTGGDRSLSVVLKHGYAPVEQYQSRGVQGPWTDVYALCATMYKCITGITPAQSLDRMYQDELESPSALGIPMYPQQEAALMRGLQIHWENRFQSMEALHSALYPVKVPVAEPKPLPEPYSRRETADPAPIEQTMPLTSGSARGGVAADIGMTRPLTGAIVFEPETKKKTRKKKGGRGLRLAGLTALCVAAVLALTLLSSPKAPKTVSGPAGSSGSFGYTLTRETVIPDGDHTLQYDIHKGILFRETGEGKLLLGPTGEVIVDTPLEDAEYLGNGLYLVCQPGGPNSAGLVDAGGNLLIPMDVCSIEWARRSNEAEGPQRYLLVGYAGQETQDEAQCFLHYSNKKYSISNSLWDGCIGYTGYGRIYDVEARAFVENVELTVNAEDTVRICGNSIAIEGEDGMNLYAPDGTVLAQLTSRATAGPGVLLDYYNGTYRILDENGRELYVSNSSISMIPGTSGYFHRTKDGIVTVIDRNGVPVIEFENSYISSEHNGVFLLRNTQTKMDSLVHRDGTVILEPKYYNYVIYLGCGLFGGYHTESRSDTPYFLAGDRGIIATNLPRVNDLVMMDSGFAYVFRDGDFTLAVEDSNPMKLGNGIIAVRHGVEKLYGVYDLFTGIQLLPGEYSELFCAGEYLYAYQNGSWEAYRITGPEQ